MISLVCDFRHLPLYLMTNIISGILWGSQDYREENLKCTSVVTLFDILRNIIFYQCSVITQWLSVSESATSATYKEIVQLRIPDTLDSHFPNQRRLPKESVVKERD